ncbi:hypothetical protein L7F22_023414 [Adiantum nelumboides]|nr:hypothetical protein [Adiantum nelumboides]
MLASETFVASLNLTAAFPHELSGNSALQVSLTCNDVSCAQLTISKGEYQDDVPWTSLIQQHVDNGNPQQAFCLFHKMQQSSVLSTRSTYLAMLRACTLSASLENGHDLHTEIARGGWDLDSGLGVSLMDMYMKCSALNDARNVFERLPFRNVILWTTLMLGYVDSGLEKRAVDCLEEMHADGVPPDAVTYICSLKACGSLGDLDMGRKLYTVITKGGFESKPFVGNALIAMYTKCGLPLEAHEVFDRLSCPDVVAWNALINGYADCGLYGDALHLLECIKTKEAILPTWITFLGGLKACNGIGSIQKGHELHAHIIEEGLEQIQPIGNALLDMYAKCGLLVEARSVFDDLPVQDIVSWSALVAGYADNGHDHDALDCLERMLIEGVPPEIPTYMSSLKACASIRSLNFGQKLHAAITAKGFEGDTGISNSLVDLYAKSGSLEEAHGVFLSIQNRDVVSWNALIAGYADYGFGAEALSLLDQMERKGLCPSIVSYIYNLKACSLIRALDKGQKVHSDIVKEGFEMDIFVSNTIVDMYLKCGALFDAHGAFEDLQFRDPISWSALLQGCAEHGHGELGHELFETMKLEVSFPDANSWDALIFGFTEQEESEKALRYFAQMQEQGLLPSTTSFISVLNLCGDVAALGMGKQLHALVSRLVPKPTHVPLANALIHMYCDCGSINDAQQLFETLPIKDIVTWNTLINGHSRHGESKLVFNLLSKMKKEGIEPEGITLLSALMVCNHAGLVEKGKMYFQFIALQFSTSSSIRHHHCIADLLGRAGHVDEAAALLGMMPFEPDLVTWGTMLGACNKWGHIKLGAQAFECVTKLDKKYTSAFVSMSNMCAEAYLWEE